MKKLIALLLALVMVIGLVACGETTPETLLDAVPYMEELSRISGLPIFAHTAQADVAKALDGRLEPVISLQLQEKYFDLPSQKPTPRPLWG